MYSETTRHITVIVQPFYLEEHSSPNDHHYVWGYYVRIENHGQERIQLRKRYWHITDADGLVQEISGIGVVGEQPTIEPGESYEYTSGTPLQTSSGVMVGKYLMENGQGERFDVSIPAFSLDSPYQSQKLN